MANKTATTMDELLADTEVSGGFEVGDMVEGVVIVADNAIVGDQHSNFGLIPGGGGTQRLPRLIGRQRALALLLSGERLNAKEAVAWV